MFPTNQESARQDDAFHHRVFRFVNKLFALRNMVSVQFMYSGTFLLTQSALPELSSGLLGNGTRIASKYVPVLSDETEKLRRTCADFGNRGRNPFYEDCR